MIHRIGSADVDAERRIRILESEVDHLRRLLAASEKGDVRSKIGRRIKRAVRTINELRATNA